MLRQLLCLTIFGLLFLPVIWVQSAQAATVLKPSSASMQPERAELQYIQDDRSNRVPVQRKMRDRREDRRENAKENMKHLSPEERQEKKQERQEAFKERWQERWDNASPEQRERLEKMRDKRQALREELQDLSPEERKARIQELRAQNQERIEENREKIQERWNNANPEQKAQFCSNTKSRCTGDGSGGAACKIAQSVCSQ